MAKRTKIPPVGGSSRSPLRTLSRALSPASAADCASGACSFREQHIRPCEYVNVLKLALNRVCQRWLVVDEAYESTIPPLALGEARIATVSYSISGLAPCRPTLASASAIRTLLLTFELALESPCSRTTTPCVSFSCPIRTACSSAASAAPRYSSQSPRRAGPRWAPYPHLADQDQSRERV